MIIKALIAQGGKIITLPFTFTYLCGTHNKKGLFFRAARAAESTSKPEYGPAYKCIQYNINNFLSSSYVFY